jgi:Transposase
MPGYGLSAKPTAPAGVPPISGAPETSHEHSLSSGNRVGCREGLVFGVGLARLDAVVEQARQAIEQVALRLGVPIAGDAARDALKLARLLRSGDLTAVWVPDSAHEALRSLVRSRADAKADQLRAKHRLSKFLLRQGCKPPFGVRSWSVRYFQWLRQLQFEHVADQVVFADHLAEVTAEGERIKRLEAALHQCAETVPR